MKKSLLVSITMILLLALFSGCNGTKPNDDTKVVKIGIFEPATGDMGAGGKQEALGMYYANFVAPTVEIDGVTYKVELVAVDNQSSKEVAPSAATTLVTEGCVVVLGSYGSGVSMAASPVFEEAGIAAIGVTCTNPNVTLGNSHYFRICFLDDFQGTVLANFSRDEFAAKKVYILAEQGDPYCFGLANFFQEAFGEANCTMETFPNGTADFSSYVASAKSIGADVFFAPVYTDYAVLIIDQMAAQGLNIPILAGDTWDSNVILNAAKGKDVKIYVTTFYGEGAAPEFDAGIKKWINDNPAQKANNGGDDKVAAVTAMGFDAYFVALEAMKKAKSVEPAKILAVMPGVTYTGVSGMIAFDENGDAKRDTAIIKFCNTATGEWEFFTQQGVK